MWRQPTNRDVILAQLWSHIVLRASALLLYNYKQLTVRLIKHFTNLIYYFCRQKWTTSHYNNVTFLHTSALQMTFNFWTNFGKTLIYTLTKNDTYFNNVLITQLYSTNWIQLQLAIQTPQLWTLYYPRWQKFYWPYMLFYPYHNRVTSYPSYIDIILTLLCILLSSWCVLSSF